MAAGLTIDIANQRRHCRRSELGAEERFEEHQRSAEGSNELEVLASQLDVGDLTDRQLFRQRRLSEAFEHHERQGFGTDETACRRRLLEACRVGLPQAQAPPRGVVVGVEWQPVAESSTTSGSIEDDLTIVWLNSGIPAPVYTCRRSLSSAMEPLGATPATEQNAVR